MVAFADTGLIASLYLEESTSHAADAVVENKREPLPLTPLAMLELRKAFNLHLKSLLSLCALRVSA